jgi:thioesterase domain-containing protein
MKGGSRPPLFCVHGAGGNVLSFYHLSQWLGRDQPFHGLQAQGTDGSRPALTTIEDMAGLYLRAIRSTQPQGPYLLAGHSGGAIIAMEMAQQLTRMGQSVALLVLLDPYHPGMAMHRPSLAQRLRHAYEHGVVSHGLEWLKGIVERHTRAARVRRARRFVRNGRPIPHELRELYAIHSFNAALKAYRPQRYPGRIHLFQTHEMRHEEHRFGLDGGWAELAGDGLSVQEIPGTHLDFLADANAEILAKKLRILIDHSMAAAASNTVQAA